LAIAFRRLRRIHDRRHLDFSVDARSGKPWHRYRGDPNVERWFDEIDSRAAVQRAVKVLASDQSSPPHYPKAWDIIFGKTQFQRR
jgi:hypothetical protein